MEKPSVREMIKRASRQGGLGVSPATRPGASPVEGTCPKSSSPEAGEGKRQQGHRGLVRVVGWIPLPQSAVQRRRSVRPSQVKR